MPTVFANTFSFALMFAAFATAASAIPRRRLPKLQAEAAVTFLSRPRLVEGLCDKLLWRLSALAAVMLAVVGPAVVAIAFLHGKLGGFDGGFVVTPEGIKRILNTREWVLVILYAGPAGLLLGAAALVLRPTEMPAQRRTGRVWPPEKRIDWPWVGRPGGVRLWAARTAALGAALGALTVVALIPTLIELLLAALEIQPDTTDSQLVGVSR